MYLLLPYGNTISLFNTFENTGGIWNMDAADLAVLVWSPQTMRPGLIGRSQAIASSPHILILAPPFTHCLLLKLSIPHPLSVQRRPFRYEVSSMTFLFLRSLCTGFSCA